MLAQWIQVLHQRGDSHGARVNMLHWDNTTLRARKGMCVSMRAGGR